MHVVGEPGHEQRVDERGRRRGAERRAVEPGADAPFGREQLLAVGVEHSAHDRLAVDLERQRGAEDRHAVGEVGGAIERVEHPAVGSTGVAAAELFGQYVVVWKSRGDEGAARPLHLEVDLGHEIDRPLLVHPHHRPEPGALDGAGVGHDFDGGGQEARIGGSHVGAPSGTARRFTRRISIPPSGIRRCTISSMKLRTRNKPRPLDFKRFSGASGSATSSGSKPAP